MISKVPCKRVGGGVDPSRDYIIPFSIPLWVIFPILLSFDDMTIYSNAGSVIEMSIFTQQLQDVFMKVDTAVGIASSYSIQNISVTHQFTRLEESMNNIIASS